MINPEELSSRKNKITEENDNSLRRVDNNKNNENSELRQQEMTEVLTNPIYTPAFLKEQIGKLMQVEFLIGTNNMVNKIGFLEDVGTSYILLRSFEGDSLIYADIYSIKFITISAPYAGISNFQNFNNIPNMGINMNTNMNKYY